MAAILVWSALPGASRHHWGTDLDVFDRAVQPPGEPLELLARHYEPGGRFERLGALARSAPGPLRLLPALRP